MPSSRRLYVALYARGGSAVMPGGEDKYHWALILGPKSEEAGARGKRYHAKETMTFVDGQMQSVWQFEERHIGMAPTSMILVRLLIGKVKHKDQLEAVLRSVPIRDSTEGWNCVLWVDEALVALQHWQGGGVSLFESSAYQLDWIKVRDTALWYVATKEAEHRFDGLAEEGAFDIDKVPTWNMLKGKETTS